MAVSRYDIRGNFMVMLGAIVVWLGGAERICDAIIAIGASEPLTAAGHAFAALGALFIGIECWKAR